MSLILLRLFLVISVAEVFCSAQRKDVHEDVNLTFRELAKKYARKPEEYEVISEDGYILKVFHIPGDSTRPVLLIPGAIDSCDSFIIRGNTSLVVALANENYDVWAMNYRGNKYSRAHVTLNPDTDREYWEFSLHEIGHYDIPAVIDLVLNKTGERRLSAIGYSEGTSGMYVLGATKPEYNDKVKVFISLAPVAYLHNTGIYMAILIQSADIINKALQDIGINEFAGQKSNLRKFIDELCYSRTGYEMCLVNGLFPLTGFNFKEIEPKFFPVVLGHFPAGTSRKNLFHLAQIGKSRRFANFDYGTDRNLELYNNTVPTEYDLNKVTMKVALIAAKNDLIADIKDVAILKKRLPNVVEYKVMEDSAFNHIDFVWGRTTHKTLFPDIFKILNKYR